MALSLLLSCAPVASDVTLSTQGTYFQNEALGRYLKGYVNESSFVPSLFHCQLRCDTLHLTCKSLNYVENEDGSNICEINYEAQNCALPGDFVLKENSFYVETVPEKDDAVLCSICGHNGAIRKTKKGPGFMCLCQKGFYGDRCEHEACDRAPCQNGGTCTTKNSSPYYTCSCLTYFIGQDCKTNTRCDTAPCQNGGTCSTLTSSPYYSCSCLNYFSGESCQTNTRCNTAPCQNGGTCTTQNSSPYYTCSCRTFFVGQNCKTNTRCNTAPCHNGGICTTQNSSPYYTCSCLTYFTGQDCKTNRRCDINPCQNGGTCVTKSSSPYYTCSCTRLFTGSECQSSKIHSSCSEALQDPRNTQNGFYHIRDSSNSYTKIYCQMASLTGCSGGGWTLIMKIDGRKETFNYFSSYWQNKQSFNPAGGLSGLDDQETKLPTYWSTSFTELCLGMKVGNDLKFTSISYPASSLYDLIADGNYRTTNLGRQKWKSLIGDSSLQRNCNKEGFNVKLTVSGYSDFHARIRIGIIGNQENDCFSPDSYVGFGGPPANKRNYCETQNVINTCGNSGTCDPDNGLKEIKAMGYIFVR